MTYTYTMQYTYIAQVEQFITLLLLKGPSFTSIFAVKGLYPPSKPHLSPSQAKQLRMKYQTAIVCENPIGVAIIHSL